MISKDVTTWAILVIAVMVPAIFLSASPFASAQEKESPPGNEDINARHEHGTSDSNGTSS